MIISKAAEHCGQADYGWLQARYTFSFGHYFDPELLGYASLRVLNQEVLAPGAAFQPRTYPQVDILNIILQGEAEYRDSNGNHARAKAGDALLLATQPNVSYSEHNACHKTSLTRLQLWLNACPTQENRTLQRLSLDKKGCHLLASPEETQDQHSLYLRQQVWIYHLDLNIHEQNTITLNGNRAYLQSINGTMRINGITPENSKTLHCGDGAFIQQEAKVTVLAETPMRALLIDLVV
ncbi:pirin family protein [Pectobacteriaceae bacterium CE70]|uniref:Pirin family protein n=1 Tax=Serratia sp. (strain ATCC 39006) TaxID=104623 RepID=A0A2I5TPV6_SERS3|nr:pirin family protein [Serratia sp. ATCC 39006]WJV63107.1 pirin family protein [Pectobacteriaceae bacterium C52]WJV67434.1 pirin family protein [Pectobacteriaceae bacterium CE70]WJY11416.1 pirin family protein [Pectobacteriaceae bacterium C80]AUH02286.1 pirin family protein [Serratia sp. ATCC 39006]AUH06608.1 pirin family protein [Serratia sp. ATCC 39006]